MDNKGELELGGTILRQDTAEQRTERQSAGHTRGRRQRGNPLRAFMVQKQHGSVVAQGGRRGGSG
jgi:hypothetical protein